MSHIIECEVTNLAGREGKFEHKFNRDINIFFGPNGSGKTSLLKVLHSAMEQDAQLLVNVPFAAAKVVIYSQDYKKQFVYTLDKTKNKKMSSRDKIATSRLKESRSSKPTLTKELDLKWKVEGLKPKTHGWIHEYLPTSRLFHMGYESEPDTRRAIIQEDVLDIRFESALRSYWVELFGEVQRKVRKLQEKALVDILNEVLTVKRTKTKKAKSLDWETAYNEMVSFLKRQNPKAKPSSKIAFSRRYAESPLLRKVVGRIDRVEKEIENKMAPQTKLQKLITKMFSGSKSIDFGETSLDVITKNKSVIGLRSLSSGEKHILYILIAVLRADFSSIIVDEPEISMHVDWQKELISAMIKLNPKAQIIAATHSPEILADIDDKKIFQL